MSHAEALQLKEEGNKYFQAGDYGQAEALYTKAIIADPTAPLLYTNRAMARIKLATMMDAVVADCDESLRLLPHNMKAHYYKAQALLSLDQPREALESAQKAYELAYESGDRTWERSLGNIVSVVLKCKKAAWEKKEVKRIRDEDRVRKEIDELMKAQLEREVSAASNEFEQEMLEKEWRGKISEFGERWDYKAPRREVPDWMIDDITFAIMYDPVITKTGNSYERASIMEHLRRSHTDPLTRSPLNPDELRPNLALRQATEEFLEANGWAVDY